MKPASQVQIFVKLYVSGLISGLQGSIYNTIWDHAEVDLICQNTIHPWAIYAGSSVRGGRGRDGLTCLFLSEDALNRVNVLLFVSRCFWPGKKVPLLRRIWRSNPENYGVSPSSSSRPYFLSCVEQPNIHKFSTANNPLTWLSTVLYQKVA